MKTTSAHPVTTVKIAPPAAPESWYSPANLVTLLRIPLAAVPWFFLDDRWVIAGTVAVAAMTDGLDGLLARVRERRLFREPKRCIGVWLDPVCDKIFVVSTLAALWAASMLPLWMAAVVGARELILGLYVAGTLLVGSPRSRHPMAFKAAFIGKTATGFQVLAVLSVLARHPATIPIAVAAGLLGTAAAVHYLKRDRSPAPDKERSCDSG